MHVSLYFLTLLKSHLQKRNNNVYFLGIRLNAVISVLTQRHWINQLLPDWNWACGKIDSFLVTQIPFVTLLISNKLICIRLSRSTWHESAAPAGGVAGMSQDGLCCRVGLSRRVHVKSPAPCPQPGLPGPRPGLCSSVTLQPSTPYFFPILFFLYVYILCTPHPSLGLSVFQSG